jgi:transcriptional regulator with XRE-family HTH domain
VIVKVKQYRFVWFGIMHKTEVYFMSILSDRIDLLCKNKGITGYRLCKDIGISPNLLTELRGGRRNGISAKTADKISNYFGVSVGYLLGTEKTEKPAGQEADGRGDAVIIHRGGRTTRRVLTDEQWKLIEGMFNLQNTGPEREDDEW